MKVESYKRPVSVLVVVYTGPGEVLLLERQRPRGFWQSVTGSLAWGEAADAAARREVREETGLASEALRATGMVHRYPILPAWRSRYAPDVQQNVEHVFLLPLPERVSIEIDPCEHHIYQWLPKAAAIGRVSSPTNRRAIEQHVPEPIH